MEIDMKTSSRNTFQGKITAIILGGLNDEVELTLASGEKVYGQLAHASAERLGLAVGGEALALVKATEILLVSDNDDFAICCRNQFSGKVLTYAYIMKELWGPRADSDNQILRVNMANIRRKIEKNPAEPQYIFTEAGVGYRMAEGD